MASRILTFVSCTLYFSILVTITVVGLTSIIIGLIGLGFYIPTLLNSFTYQRTICSIINHQYDICHQAHDSCYSIMWSVEYIVGNNTYEQYIFATITKIYKSPVHALNTVKTYKDKGNYTCYYLKKDLSTVQWDQPPSPMPYFILMIVGFSLTVIYFIIIGLITVYRYLRR